MLCPAWALWVLVQAGNGAELPIANRSFETPALSEGEFPQGAPSGWTGTGIIGVMNPADDFFTGTTDAGPNTSALDGRNAVGFNYGGEVSHEDPNIVVQPNYVYSLTLLVGERKGVPFGDALVGLWAGTNLLVERVPNPPAGEFIPFSMTYTSPPAGPMIGKPLRISLKAPTPGSQVWFDNVHLFGEDLICTPHKARAVAQLFNGIFVGATMIDYGCAYTNPPIVTIQGGGGNGAAATAHILNGKVAEIRVTNGGCCYSSLPTIMIDSPPHAPILTITVSKVTVRQDVNLGERYVLESSFDSIIWTPTGPAFTADSETIETEFDVNVTGRFFRVRHER